MKNKIDSSKDKIFRMVISVLMAFFLWVYALSATGQTETKQFKDIPVKIINESSLTALDLALDNEEYTVDVKLYGSSLKISQIRKSDLVAIADVSSIKSVGSHSIAVSISGLSENVSVSEINDRYLNISVSELTEAERSIDVARGGVISEGYAIVSEEYSSKVAVVYGNEQNVQSVVSVRGSIDISSMSSDITRRANLTAYDTDGNVVEHVTIVPSYVDVSITVGKIKEVPVSVVTAGEVLEGYVVSEVSPEVETVRLVAKDNVLSTIDVITTAAVDLTGKSASFTQTVSLHGIEGVVLLDEGPIKVSFTVEPKENKEISFATIRFLNTPTGLSCNLVDFGGLSAVFSGDKRILQEMDEHDITAFIDLKDLKEGDHELPVQFDMPEGIDLKGSQDIKVNVRLTK